MAYEPLKAELSVNQEDSDKGEPVLLSVSKIDSQPQHVETQQVNHKEELEEEEEEGEEDTVTLLKPESGDEIEPNVVEIIASDGSIKAGRTADKRIYKTIRYVLGIGSFVLLFVFLTAAITLIAISPSCSDTSKQYRAWWQGAVIYQCYPQSFQDTNGDGVGDLNGIRKRVGYFESIGIDTIWLNPIFNSPQQDNGYDVSNYTSIHPVFGTLDDLAALLSDLHSVGIRLLLDLVPNHTSDKHPWFLASKSSKADPKRNWYVWAEGVNGGPPNNWISVFGGSAWTLDNTTNQYYLHQFSEFQPDLNYHNQEVRDVMEDVMRFWLDFGVDGFRVDAVMFLLEDPNLQSEAKNPSYSGSSDCTVDASDSDCYRSLIHNRTTNYDGIHSIIKSWRKLIDSYNQPRNEKFIVGEIYDSIEKVAEYYGTNNDEFNFPFNFFLLQNTNWTGTNVSQIVSNWLDNMPAGAWPNWVLGNHDNSRIASRAGKYLARALNVLLLTLPGTATTYYGEEILMTDVEIPPNRTNDQYLERDGERTPMQWNTTANAGFTEAGVEPWLPLGDDYTVYNVEVEERSEASMLSLYKNLTRLRSGYAAFKTANYELLLNTTQLYAYRRFDNSASRSDKYDFIVVVNFSQDSVVANLSSAVGRIEEPVIELSSNMNRTGSVDLKAVDLGIGEAVVIKGASKQEISCS